MYEIYGKSKEQALPMINIKALLFSVSFESQTDKQLVKCEDEKQRLVCLFEELEAQDNHDATVHVIYCVAERGAPVVSLTWVAVQDVVRDSRELVTSHSRVG